MDQWTLEELVEQRVETLRQESFSTLLALPKCKEELVKVGGKDVQLFTIHDVVNDKHRFVLQAARRRWGGHDGEGCRARVRDRVRREGPSSHSRGVVRFHLTPTVDIAQQLREGIRKSTTRMMAQPSVACVGRQNLPGALFLANRLRPRHSRCRYPSVSQTPKRL